MLLQRSFKLSLLVLVLVLAGCASSGPKSTRSDNRNVPSQALTLYERATAAMAAGDLAGAERRFSEFVVQYPNYPGAYVNLAIIHASNGNNDAGLNAIEAALAIDADYAPALNQKGMLLRKNGNFPEAEAAYLKAVTADSDYALAHYNLGVLNELYLQRLDVALQHYERYQELVDDDKQVEKWIADLRRRVAAIQRTAKVAD